MGLNVPAIELSRATLRHSESRTAHLAFSNHHLHMLLRLPLFSSLEDANGCELFYLTQRSSRLNRIRCIWDIRYDRELLQLIGSEPLIPMQILAAFFSLPNPRWELRCELGSVEERSYGEKTSTQDTDTKFSNCPHVGADVEIYQISVSTDVESSIQASTSCGNNVSNLCQCRFGLQLRLSEPYMSRFAYVSLQHAFFSLSSFFMMMFPRLSGYSCILRP